MLHAIPCPFSPQYLPRTLQLPESRVPTPLSSHGSAIPFPRLPRTCPQSHGPRLFTPRFPEHPRLTWLSPRSASPPGPGGSQRHAPHGSRTSTPSPSCQLNRLRAVNATPVSAWVVWVVPAVHSRPPVSWVFSAVFCRGL